MYFRSEGIPGLVQRSLVLMKVRIVNTGPDETSITDIKLTINVGDNRLSANLLKIPSSWRIRKRKTELMNLAYGDTPPEPPC